LVDGEEVARRGLRGRRQIGCGLQPGVELIGLHLDVVAEALVAEADVERHDPEVREALRCVWKVGGRIEDDGGVLDAQVHAAAARRTESTISFRSTSFVRQLTAPAAIRSSISPADTDAVRQTTRVPGHASSTAR